MLTKEFTNTRLDCTIMLNSAVNPEFKGFDALETLLNNAI